MTEMVTPDVTILRIFSPEELSLLKEELIARAVARKMGVSYTSSQQLDKFNAHFEASLLWLVSNKVLMPEYTITLQKLTWE